MEVASAAEGDGNFLGGEAGAELFGLGRVYGGIEAVGAVGVRRADDVSDAVGGRKFCHGDRCLHAVGAVVQAGKKVMMDIYHYAAARLRAMDWKSRRPSADPRRLSLERSGGGILPTPSRPSLSTPAMFSSEPLGLASAVISPAALE